jgi:hypothetical protein
MVHDETHPNHSELCRGVAKGCAGEIMDFLGKTSSIPDMVLRKRETNIVTIVASIDSYDCCDCYSLGELFGLDIGCTARSKTLAGRTYQGFTVTTNNNQRQAKQIPSGYD